MNQNCFGRRECQADPMLRRDPGRSLQEAEELALKTLETLTKTPMLGVR